MTRAAILFLAVASASAAPPGITLRVTEPAPPRYVRATIPPPSAGWSLARVRKIQALITNLGPRPVTAALWAVPTHGWDGISDFATLQPGQSRTYSCDLRSTFPDGTPMLDPARIASVQVMLRQPKTGDAIEVRSVQTIGEAPPFLRPAARLEVPEMEDAPPAAGRRVRFSLGGTYAALYLPADWQPGRQYPVIAEFPGNVFFDPACYSTGRPEGAVIGYGITQGRGAIWVTLPFVDARASSIVEDGWGDPDSTAAYALRVLDEINRRFGGDPARTFLTGFSRGAIAGGFIGLRNPQIAARWKAIHTCQHFDGDGWRGAALPEAMDRARRFSGRPVFHTDNDDPRLRAIMADATIPATFAASNLGSHSMAMFLDDRPTTLQLRQWFQALAAPFPGKTSTWQGHARFDFEFAGRPVTVVAPETPAPGRPWLWRGEFFGAFPSVDLALLKLGWHVVYMACPNTFGSPDTMQRWSALYDELTGRYHLSPRPVLLGMSRGGLYVYHWAALHPGQVGLIYGDAPVCDVKSWPGGKGKGKGSPNDWALFQQVYGLDEPAALAWNQNPIDILQPIARARIPILHVVGDADDVVPVEENTAILMRRYQALGGLFHLISKPGVGHHPHSLEDPAPIVAWILEHRLL